MSTGGSEGKKEELTLPILVPERFRIIAHRGASAYAPENTMAAFSLAEQMGVAEVELDVQLSTDGYLVICHDRVLDRYGHPGRVLAELALSELKVLDMGSWFSAESFRDERMPTLEELFERFGTRFIYHVEIKEQAPGIEQAVLDEVDSHGLASAVVVTSFHYAALRTVRRLNSAIPIGWLVGEEGLSRENSERAAEIGCMQICPRASDLTVEDVRAAHKTLPEVRAHRVRTVADVHRVIESGCDGLTINHPDWLKHHDPRREPRM